MPPPKHQGRLRSFTAKGGGGAHLIKAAGGGGKSSSGSTASSVEDPNTLISDSYVSFVHLICEGEIEGLVNGFESVYLNNTPIISDAATVIAVLPMDIVAGSATLTFSVQDPAQLAGIQEGLNVIGTGIPTGSIVTAISESAPWGVAVNLPPVDTQTATQVTFQTTTETNFQNFTVLYRYGLQVQDPFPGFNSVLSEVADTPPNPITVANPQVMTIDDTDANAAIVSVYLPICENQLISGSQVTLQGSSVNYAIDYQPLDSDYIQALTEELNGKCTSPYIRTHRINLTGTGPWNIRIRRTSPDSVDSNTINTIYWYSLESCIDLQLTYPNSVMFAGQFDASQFSAIPSVCYNLKLLKIKIPTNYDPLTWVYATSGPGTTNGVWDGTFKVAWSDNPAWCFYDLLTNARYGLGGYLPDTAVDKFALYSIAQYCDGLVPDGYGGMERRLVCNLFIQNRDEAFRVLANMASVFRGLIFWASGQVNFFQDSPLDPSATFVNASVTKGQFTYAGTALKARHTVALVTWNDPTNFSSQQVEYVENTAAVLQYGVRELEITAFGCASRGQARRVGRWALYTEWYETEVVTFETGQDATMLAPGAVINVVDQTRAGVRMGGRLISASTSGMVLDAPVAFNPEVTYTAYTTNPAGELVASLLVNPGTTTATVAFSMTRNGPDVPAPDSVWAISGTNIVPQLFRIISVAETNTSTYKVAALSYNPGKYAYVEDAAPFAALPISLSGAGAIVTPPTSFGVTESFNVIQGTVYRYLNASWTPSTDTLIKYYLVEYQVGNDNWIKAGETAANSLTFLVTVTGEYNVRLSAVNVNGNASPYAYSLINVTDTTLDNSGISGLELVGQGNDTTFLGNDPAFDWNYTSPDSTAGLDGGQQNPTFQKFVIQIWDTRPTPPVLLRTDYSIIAQYTYTYANNFSDTGGFPSRYLQIAVAVQDILGDVSDFVPLQVSNPAPLVGASPPTLDQSLIRISSKSGQLFISYSQPTPPEADFVGMLVFASIDPDFAISDIQSEGELLPTALIPFNIDTNAGTLLYSGPDTTISLNVPSLASIQLILAPYDSFGLDGLNFYGPIKATLNNVASSAAPGVPQGLTVSTLSTIGPDGTQLVQLIAKFTPNSEPDLLSYGWSLRQISGAPTFDMSGNVTGYTELTQIYQPAYGQVAARTAAGGYAQGTDGKVEINFTITNPGAWYEVRVDAINTSAISSAWSNLTSNTDIQSAVDTVAPPAPTWVSANAAFRLVTLAWDNPGVSDFFQSILYQSATNDFTTATQVYAGALTGQVLQFPLTGNFDTETLYFWLKAEDDSGNLSVVSAVQAVSLAGVQAATGLSLSTSLQNNQDGSQVVNVSATWGNPNGAEAITAFYTYGTDPTFATFTGSGTTSGNTVSFPVLGNTQYYFQVRIQDSNAGLSTFEQANILSASKTVPPSAPTGLTALSSIRAVFLSWALSADTDIADVNIFRSTTNVLPGSPYQTISRGTTYTDLSVTQGTTYYYWIQEVDTSGLLSAVTASVSTLPGTVAASDITNFAVGLTKQYNNTISLTGFTWLDTIPTSLATTWSAGTLYFQGAAYSIAGGNTTNGYIYWDAAFPTVFQTSATNPVLTDAQFMIATNVAGEHDLAWNAMANALIGSAYIQNLAVTNAKIESLAIDKLTTGTLSAQVITLAASGGLNAAILSSNYDGTLDGNNNVTAQGTQGIFINSAGYAEINNGVFRGSITAGSITIGAEAFQVNQYGQMWLGASTFAAAPFRVDTNGAMTASNATLSGYLVVGGAAGDVNAGSTTIAGGKIAANSITASQLAATITTTKQLIIDAGGVINSIAATSFASGVGFWLANTGSTTVFRVGDPSAQYIQWDGNTLSLVGGINLTGLTTLASVATSGSYSSLSGKPALSSVATSGAYGDLSGTPALSSVATSGSYGDLYGTPTLAAIATSGLYSDASGRPTSLNDLDVSAASKLAGIAAGATNGAVYGANLSGGPFNSPSGAGLFIDPNYFGFYSGSAWQTYMDSSGNFFLNGPGASSLSWFGGNLTIVGQVNATFLGANCTVSADPSTGTSRMSWASNIGGAAWETSVENVNNNFRIFSPGGYAVEIGTGDFPANLWAHGNIEFDTNIGLIKTATDGWTVPLFTGSHKIDFTWTGTQFVVRVDGTNVWAS